MEKATHFIVIRPNSDLNNNVLKRAWSRTGSSHQPSAVLACHTFCISGNFAQCTVLWSGDHPKLETQRLWVPVSEILLLIEASDNAERTFGFLQE